MKFPKPEPHKRTKARKDRAEAAEAKRVREACVQRDGYCRIMRFGCKGPSEWAHLEEHRRFKTRGMSPEERHSTAGSVMMCKKHHDAYDAHAFDVEFLTDRGADGMIRLTNIKLERLGIYGEA